MRKLPVLLGVAACVAAAPRAHASLVRAMDLAALTSTADQVVVADVAKVESQWDKDHRTIYTTVEIQVQESWKGSPPSDGKLVLRQPGGTVGEIEVTVVGMPTFSVGEHALLFLKRTQVVGLGQGKRTLRWDGEGKRWLAAPADTSGLLKIGRPEDVRAASNPAPETLESLRAKVRALLEK